MNVTLYGAGFALGLGVGMFVLLEVGRRIGTRIIAKEGEAARTGLGAIEGAIFGLMGLLLAFSFSGAAARFDVRRHLVVEETNDIGTAWLRIDLLPPESQTAMRDLFRRYLDSRIETYRRIPDMEAVAEERAVSAGLQKDIWKLAVASTTLVENRAATMLLLPSLNAMFDITTTRAEAMRVHPPLIVYGMLGVLALACSLLAGYEMAGRARLNLLHAGGFTLAVAVTVYVITDFEYPRMGLIKMTDSDVVMVELRKSMN
jgi:hypothetical protein